MNHAERRDQEGGSSEKKGMENLITCRKCHFVYDIRYLSESCRFEEGAGYQCMNCGAIL